MRLAGAESTHGVSLRPAKGKNFFFEKKVTAQVVVVDQAA